MLYGSAKRDLVHWQRGGAYSSGYAPYLEGGSYSSGGFPYQEGGKRGRKKTKAKKNTRNQTLHDKYCTRKLHGCPERRGKCKKSKEKRNKNRFNEIHLVPLRRSSRSKIQKGGGLGTVIGTLVPHIIQGILTGLASGQRGSGVGDAIRKAFGRSKKLSTKMLAIPEVRSVAKTLAKKGISYGVNKLASKASRVRHLKKFVTPGMMSKLETALHREVDKRGRQTGSGLLFGKNSPFDGIPILGDIF